MTRSIGMFEQLLVKELQKQQHRAQFCDTVLQAQGISVPVHSCVLSAFSPRLCEFLSTLPALPNGRSRVIQLQAVETQTLFRLVRALYSGHVEGEREDLQAAADKLGITLPQEIMEDGDTEDEGGEERVKDGIVGTTGGSKEGEELKGTDRREYKDVGTQIDVTQTDSGRQNVQMDTQTDSDITSSLEAQFMYEKLKLVDLQSAIPLVDHMSHFPWVTDASEAMPSTLDDATVCQLFTGAAIGAPNICPALFLPPPEDQPIETGRLHTAVHEGGDIDNSDGVSGEGQLVEGFEQFEGNIPEFISHFLDSSGSRRRGRRIRRSSGGGRRAEKRGGERTKRPRGGTDKGGEEEGLSIAKVERRFPLREGRSVELTSRGVGGGRIGRSLRLPPRKKARAKPYSRQSSVQVNAELDQDEIPATRKRRGRQRVRPLPLRARLPPPGSSAPTNPNLSYLSPSPTMPPTVPLTPPAPARSLLEQLLFELNQPSPASHNAQNDTQSTTTPRIHSPSGTTTETKIWQQQPDGEVSDMLDHLMQSLEQPADMMPYTIIKDLQECHRREEVRDAVPQPNAPPLASHQRAPQPATHTTHSHPHYRRHCKPCDRREKGGHGKKMILEEVNMSAEMFEERRMTRNQAKLIRTSSTNAWATSSTVQDNPSPKRLRAGKNMSKLRQKLLGKRKREEEEEKEKEEGEEEEDQRMEGSPSSVKKSKLSTGDTSGQQSPCQAEGSD